MNKFALFIFITLFLPLHAVNAATVYKWVDESGRTHFSDNPANIPLKQETYQKRELKTPHVQPKVELNGSSAEDLNLGSSIWKSTCLECHYIKNYSSLESRRRLPDNILNPNQSSVELTKNLKHSLELRSGDMNDIKLTDEEISSVAKYILSITSE